MSNFLPTDKQMNQEVLEDWLFSLRSGRYQQSQGMLKTTDGKMCCLGVLCDRLDPQGWEDPETGKKTPGGYVREHRLGSGALNQKTNKSIGLGFKTESVCIDKNDNGDSFEEIADYLEEELLIK